MPSFLCSLSYLSQLSQLSQVTINMKLQKRFLTKKSIGVYLQWQKMSNKKNGGDNSTDGKKSTEVQMRSKQWGDIGSTTGTAGTLSTTGTGGTSASNGEEEGILELYLDSTSHVPLPLFLSAPDAAVIDTAKQMISDQDSRSQSNNGKIALREVIRSMDVLPDKLSQALPAILQFIRKQQGLPLGLRDWDKAQRYQAAYEFLTVGRGGIKGGKGGLMDDNDEFISLVCEYLSNLENRSAVALDLKMEIVRLNNLQRMGEEWSNTLQSSKVISAQYLDELLARTEDKSKNQKTKESLVDRGIAGKNELTNYLVVKESLASTYGGGNEEGGGVDSKGAYRVSTLVELQKLNAIINVDFGRGLLATAKKSKHIKYYFSNRNASTTSSLVAGGVGSTTEVELPKTTSDQFVVTSVYEDDFVIDEFELSTDELVSLDKSSLVEWRPTGSNTTFRVKELLMFMKDLQLRELMRFH